MAGCVFTAVTTAEGLLASSSMKTVLKIISPSSNPIKIKEWGVFFDGVSVTAEPVNVALCIYSTDETQWTTVASVPVQRSGPPIVSKCIVQALAGSSSHGSSGVLASLQIHPQSGYQEKFAFGDEIVIAGSKAVAIQCTAATTVNVKAQIVYEE
jgi:hypothetical protein